MTLAYIKKPIKFYYPILINIFIIIMKLESPLLNKEAASSWLLKLFILCLLSQMALSQNTTNPCIVRASDQTVYYNCSLVEPCSCAPAEYVFKVDFVFACLTLLVSSIIIVGFVCVKEMREPPGDIVFGFALANSILAIEWMTESLMQIEGQFDPRGRACYVISYIDIIATLLSSFYNFVFFCFFFLATRSSLRITRIPQHLCHIIPILATIVSVFYMFAAGDSGFGCPSMGYVITRPLKTLLLWY